MKTIVYSLARKDLERMSSVLPDHVREKAGQSGCFTLGAVVSDGEKNLLTGMCQFFINPVTEDQIVAELAYTYVYEEYRREGVGLALLDRMTSILKKSGVEKSLTILVSGEEETLGYGFSLEELDEFLREGEFLPAKDNEELWRMAERDLFAGIPDIYMPTDSDVLYI